MNSKLSLILFVGALVALAVLSATENADENSLPEEITYSRLVRSADADPGKRKKKSIKNKKASRKASKKEKKSKTRKARQNKKADKKDRKSRRNKKSRKTNKSTKNRKIRKGKSTVPDTCATTAVNALYNGFSKKASNFDRQSKRIEARLPVIAKKLSKASEYNQTLDYLNALNSCKCPASAKTELTALIATLGECQTNIETACAKPMFNQTQIDECKPIVEGFVAEVEKCFDLNSDAAAACDCWESDAMA